MNLENRETIPKYLNIRSHYRSIRILPFPAIAQQVPNAHERQATVKSWLHIACALQGFKFLLNV